MHKSGISKTVLIREVSLFPVPLYYMELGPDIFVRILSGD